MRLGMLALVVGGACALHAEGTTPKPRPEEYGAHAQAGEQAIGASYYSKSFTSEGRSFFLSRYLVVEVAVYGPKGKRTELTGAKFTLHINGAERGILPVAGSLAAYDVKWGDVDRGIMAQVGPVVVGGRGTERRFPGDRPEVSLPRVPAHAGKEPEENQDLPELLTEAALPQGEAVLLPVSGYLYFPYEKKIKSVKKLDLVYRAPAGKASLRLK